MANLFTPGLLKIVDGVPAVKFTNYSLFDIIVHKIETEKKKLLLINASTGFGKSLDIPRTLRTHTFCPVIVLCPKVSIVIGISNYIHSSIEYPDLNLGNTLGYLTGDKSIRPTQTSYLLYTTYAIGASLIKESSSLKRIFIIDESHDITDAQLCDLMNDMIHYVEGNDVLIFMSATLNLEIFQDIFRKDLKNNTIVCVDTGYKVTHEEVRVTTKTFQQRAHDIIAGRHSRVIWFNSTMNLPKSFAGCHVRPLNSKVISSNPAILTEKKEGIIYNSTSAVESGVTLPDVTLVIDDMTSIRRVSFCIPGITALIQCRAGEDTMTQRGGRTGRTCPGENVRFMNTSTIPNLQKKTGYNGMGVSGSVLEPSPKFVMDIMEDAKQEVLQVPYFDVLTEHMSLYSKSGVTLLSKEAQTSLIQIAANLKTEIVNLIILSVFLEQNVSPLFARQVAGFFMAMETEKNITNIVKLAFEGNFIKVFSDLELVYRSLNEPGFYEKILDILQSKEKFISVMQKTRIFTIILSAFSADNDKIMHEMTTDLNLVFKSLQITFPHHKAVIKNGVFNWKDIHTFPLKKIKDGEFYYFKLVSIQRLARVEAIGFCSQ